MIPTKQKSKKLTKEEINSFISNLNSIKDEEIIDWLKAVKEHGLDDEETSHLTLAMAKSGTILSWEGLEPTIDKHSSGGIGDKITLLFAPLVAAYGINIPKLSGRGLEISGGTIDKLESISDFNTNLSIDQMKKQIQEIGIAISSTTKDLAPADKKLYAIRDITGTVDSIPLIASSIMSKKFAGGSKNIILDVKTGSGAFLKELSESKKLAYTMVSIGKKLNKNIKALVTDMSQPLGFKIGNGLEIEEVLEVLSGKDIFDLTELVILLAIEAITLINPNPEFNLEEKLRKILLQGSALQKFKEMVKAQKGDLEKGLPKAKHIEVIKSTSSGFIGNIDAYCIGKVVHMLGAGRTKTTDSIDHSVGITLIKKAGEGVRENEPILEIHAKNKEDATKARVMLESSIKIGHNKPAKSKLIHEIVK
ncbi:MAG: thymidine phosphorylase [Candidatus Melainabacteria bacterium]|nr:thymidine phosphorylase [Candidatus Melainabacteria bacterium]